MSPEQRAVVLLAAILGVILVLGVGGTAPGGTDASPSGSSNAGVSPAGAASATAAVASTTPGVPAPSSAAGGHHGFHEVPVFTGLRLPTSVRFAADGRAFVIEQAGLVKVFDSVADPVASTVLDLRDDVNSFFERGLLGIAVDPRFLQGRPYLYLYYVYDAPRGEAHPYWKDECPTPPGPHVDGCPVVSHLDRVELDPLTNRAVPGTRRTLISDWCQQFPSHAGGAIGFGPDGYLYVGGGDGAHYFWEGDYGQYGGTLPNPAIPVTPVNPCGDPVTVTGADENGLPVVDKATAEGGRLRAQDVRTLGDPTALGGTVIRIDPDTGHGVPGNPLHGGGDQGAGRIIAYGLRNPYRFAFHPSLPEVWIGDVGGYDWEEVNRVLLPAGYPRRAAPDNFGWPCLEAHVPRMEGVRLCTDLLAEDPPVVVAPWYQYSQLRDESPDGPCISREGEERQSAAVSGLAFYRDHGGSNAYPARFDGALFFTDITRSCLAALGTGEDGAPRLELAIRLSGMPVDLVVGPDGELYYVDIGGRVVRVRYAGPAG